MDVFHQRPKIANGCSSTTMSAGPSVMRIDLNAMRYNLKQFCSVISSKTKMMMIIKAAAYGAGMGRIGRWAEETHMIDYLGVAYASEGVELRKARVALPIMVMNIDQSEFDTCQTFQLEPVIYSLPLLKQLIEWLESNNKAWVFPNIHVKMNTGMNRLGLDLEEIPEFLEAFAKCACRRPRIASIYSHAAASDDPQEDQYTAQQTRVYLSGIRTFETGLGYSVMKHMCNSMGMLRHPQLHFDMVRVGGGLYGAAECFLPFLSPLLPAISLFSTIAQVRHVTEGSTIGYNRRGQVTQDSFLGIVRIGYADGLRRQLGNEHGHAWIHGCRVPFIGSICMDFATVDLTNVPIENKFELENETVEIFGEHINVEEVARCANTIVFDFICTIGARVKRVYIDDGNSTT